MMLLKQLKKDRRKAIESYIDTIDHFIVTGEWVKSYIGNQIVENQSLFDSTDEGYGDTLKTPMKDWNIENPDDKPL